MGICAFSQYLNSKMRLPQKKRKINFRAAHMQMTETEEKMSTNIFFFGIQEEKLITLLEGP